MSGKPRILDLFCGAGGAARGYQEAGFHVTGVDIVDQPNYAGDEFHRVDALFYLGHMRHWPRQYPKYAAVHSSPPCQRFSTATAWRGRRADHPELVRPTREALKAMRLPYVIENVAKAPLRADFMLCGTMFNLPFRRHRYFETNWADLHLTQSCQHRAADLSFDHGGKQPESVYRDAMQVPWMTVRESRQAVPPVYTKWIGDRLLTALHTEEKEAA